MNCPVGQYDQTAVPGAKSTTLDLPLLSDGKKKTVVAAGVSCPHPQKPSGVQQISDQDCS